MKILHIHQDYPDGRPYPFTKAVSNLIDACKVADSSVEHFVLSINRTSNPLKISINYFEDGLSLVYWALPLPFIYKPIIWLWSMVLVFILRKVEFSVIHGHKLTTEGLFSYFLAKKLLIPYFISVRGGSDMHNYQRLKDLAPSFSNVYHNAEHIFWVSAWAKGYFEEQFNIKNQKSTTLANICAISKLPKMLGNRERYCTILSYHQLRRKGLFPLLEALVLLREQDKEILLDIIVSGPSEQETLIIDKIKMLGLESQVKVLGQLTHPHILENLSQSKGLLLPAVNETFGMAYVEALACKCPILYVANTGIDGYLDDVNVGAKLDSQLAGSIANGVLAIEGNSESIADQLEQMLQTGYLKKFTANTISMQYLNKVRRFIKS